MALRLNPYMVFQMAYFFLAAVATFLILWVFFTKKAARWRIRPEDFDRVRAADDFKWTLVNLIFLFLYSYAISTLTANGVMKTQIYVNIEERGYLYLAGSYLVFLLCLDFLKYWIHRISHMNGLYSWTHAVHHRTYAPTPFTAFTGHPVEWFLNSSLPLLIAVHLIPIHYSLVYLFIFVNGNQTIYRHFGHEFIPPGFLGGWFHKYVASAAVHQVHHEDQGANYGTMFVLWDRIFGTYRPPIFCENFRAAATRHFPETALYVRR